MQIAAAKGSRYLWARRNFTQSVNLRADPGADQSIVSSFSFPEAAILLVSDGIA